MSLSFLETRWEGRIRLRGALLNPILRTRFP